MVLVMLVVVTTLTGTVMLVYLAQHRFVVRDMERLQAVYAAEAAVYAAVDRFEADPAWRADQETLEIAGITQNARSLPGAPTVATGTRVPQLTVTARALGGYLQVHATAEQGHARATVQALFGQEPFEPFEHAVVFGDTTTALVLAGRTQVTGGILTGLKGVRTAPLRRHPFTGAFRGRVHRRRDPLPELDSRLFAETVERFEGYLAMLPDSLSRFPEVWTGGGSMAEERLFADSLALLQAGDGTVLSEADSALLAHPVFLVAAGDVTLTGAVRLAPGSTVVVGGVLRIPGALLADDCMLFADRVLVSGPSELSGQILARRAIELDGGAYLRDPSVVYIAAEGTRGPREDRIEIGRAVVDGTVVYPPYESRSQVEGAPPRGEPTRVVLGTQSRVRGSVYNARKTEAEGQVAGTLLTHETYLYESPVSYQGWLSSPVLDREARPDPYVLPLVFPRRSRAVPLHWTESTELVSVNP